jgi:beta-lactamase class A
MFGVARDHADEKIWRKNGPEIGNRTGDIAYLWHLHPLDPVKLEAYLGASMTAESAETPSPRR